MSSPAFSRHAQLLRTVDAEIQAWKAAPPAQPAGLAQLLLRATEGLDRLPPDVALAAATRELRDQLYFVPGHERQSELLWREALTTSLFAGRIARVHGWSAATACFAGLLHRVGEVLILRIISKAERVAGASLDPGRRGRLSESAQRDLAESVLRGWRLPAGISAAVLDWRQMGQLGLASRESMAVYFGHLLAVETLYPEFCAPGLADSIGENLGFDSAQLEALRSTGVTPREFLLALG